MEIKQKKIPDFFIEGPVNPFKIAELIAKHNAKKDIGAHQLFMGQVRADEINGQPVEAIEYTAYKEMAENLMTAIREETIVKHKLSCAHILHSLGRIESGEICFLVFVSSPHRNAAFEACTEMVNRIKSEVPIFGKEICSNSHQWKANFP